MSKQDFTNYINSWIGKGYDGDNFPKGFEIQCTDWPPKFIMDFAGLESPFGMRISGGAKDWFEDFGRSGARPQWGPEKIANTPSGFPMAGDIVVWGSNLGSGYGHVAVADFNDNPNVVNVIEQNGIGGGKGRGGDAIRRFQRPQAPLGWIRIPAIYNKIFKEEAPNVDSNTPINNWARNWDKRLQPWGEDDGNDYGHFRGLWYDKKYEQILNIFAERIRELQKPKPVTTSVDSIIKPHMPTISAPTNEAQAAPNLDKEIELAKEIETLKVDLELAKLQIVKKPAFEIPERLKSRKFWSAIFAVAYTITSVYKPELQSSVFEILSVIGVYIGVEGVNDIINPKK